MVDLISLALVCTAAILIQVYFFKKRKIPLPPGPRGLPLLGNLLQIGVNAPAKFSQWAGEFGKVYTVYLGRTPALVVSDAGLMKQLFGMNAAAGKFSSVLIDTMFEGSFGVFNTNREEWSQQRAFCVHTLKMQGYHQSSRIEPVILAEVEQLSGWMEGEMQAQGKVCLGEALKVTTGNILWALVTGERIKTNVTQLLHDWVRTFQVAANSGLGFFSWIRYVAPKASGYTAYLEACQNLSKFVAQYFERAEKTGGAAAEGVIGSYVEHVKGMRDEKSSFYGETGMKHGIKSVVGLLVAGTESTSATLNWLLFYLAVHPVVQTKVQQEIDEIVGDNREPTLEDRKRMPYLEAVIEETLRMSSVVAYGLIHVLLEDVQWLQYQLPKGLLLIANIYHAHYDPIIWGDPRTFRPERFLRENGVSVQNEGCRKMGESLKDNVVTFQPGKRACPGEQFFRDTIFLFAVKMLKSYTFEPEKGRTREDYLEPDVGYFLLPQNLGVVLQPRRG